MCTFDCMPCSCLFVLHTDTHIHNKIYGSRCVFSMFVSFSTCIKILLTHFPPIQPTSRSRSLSLSLSACPLFSLPSVLSLTHKKEKFPYLVQILGYVFLEYLQTLTTNKLKFGAVVVVGVPCIVVSPPSLPSSPLS